jgi:hypothetical protein
LVGGKGDCAKQGREAQKLLPVLDGVKTLRVSSVGPVILLRTEANLDVSERLMNNFPAEQAKGNPEEGKKGRRREAKILLT